MTQPNDTIAPALSAEEWRGEETWDTLVALYRFNGGVFFHCGDGSGSAIGGDHLAAAVALANHALPDDDPRKITRADVARLNIEVARADAEYDAALRSDPQDLSGFDRFNELRTLAAKLAALLPPAQ
jgi:hypothetical protein